MPLGQLLPHLAQFAFLLKRKKKIKTFFFSLSRFRIQKKRKMKMKHNFCVPRFPGAQCPVTGTLNKQPANMIPCLCSAGWKPQVALHPDTPTDQILRRRYIQLSKMLLSSDKGYQEGTWSFLLNWWRFCSPRNVFCEKVSVHASDSAQQTASVIHYGGW